MGVLLGGWRRSRSWVTTRTTRTTRSWVTTMAFLALVLPPLVNGFDKEPGLLELGLLAKYPEYQAVVRPFKKRNGGGLNFKRNGGVPDECRGKYDTSIYTQLDNICEDCYNLYKEADVHQFWQTALVQVTSKDASRPCSLKRIASSTWSRSSAERDSALHRPSRGNATELAIENKDSQSFPGLLCRPGL